MPASEAPREARAARGLPLATDQLATRACRERRPALEREVIERIEHASSNSGEAVLRQLADGALELCRAQSAGVTVEELDEAGQLCLRWRAVSGRFAPYVGGQMPRNFSPCGYVLDRGRLELMTEPVGFYPYIAQFPHIAEVLLMPILDERRALGTLWVVDHDGVHHFDAEDARALERLATHADTALRNLLAAGAAPSADPLDTR